MSFSFGAPSSAPATSALSGGFSFGTNKPATPGFGLTAATQPTTSLFGNPATSAPSFGTTAFGAASTTPAFGATTTPAFGSTTPAFGTGASAFGASSAAPAFGTTAPAFGSTAPSFGATAAPAFGASSAAPTFGAASTAPTFGTSGLGTGLSFGAGLSTSTTGTALSFGAPAATTANTGFGGLGGFGFGTTTSAPSTGLSLFPSSISTVTTSSSLFGAQIGVTGTQASTLPTPSLGLGGSSTATGGIGAANTTTDSKNEPPKQTKLPNEISTNVNTFKEFVKKQKSLSSEVMRVSIKPLHKVSRDAEAKLREAVSLSGEVSRSRAHCKRLRAFAASALAAAEAVNRDYTTPGLELENTAPPLYVKDLISELEQQLITFRRQMEVADKQIQSSPKLLTEQELTLGIRRMHESLVALAGRLQAVHTQVEAQKEQYLNLRKYILKDPKNVFECSNTNSSLDQILRDADSNKKMKSSLTDMGRSSAVLSDLRSVLGGMYQLAGPTPFSYVGGALSPYPNMDATGPSWQPQATQLANSMLNSSAIPLATASTESGTFQLQKPPGKRGKQ